MRDLKDKRAVITGGASGIGLAIARRLAREGARLVLVDLRAPALEESAATLRSEGHEVAVEQVDVSDFSQVAQLAKRLHANGGCVDVLCNNAGVDYSA